MTPEPRRAGLIRDAVAECMTFGPADVTVASDAGPAERARPARIVDVELAAPLGQLTAETDDGRSYEEAWLMVRLAEEPVGIAVVPFRNGVAEVAAQVDAISRSCAAAVRSRAAAARLDADELLAGRGASGPVVTPFLQAHERIRASGPPITVAICTRNRAPDLRRALDSLRSQSYRRFRVLVIDNAPNDRQTADLVASLAEHDPDLDYVVEPRPGLSWARNRALQNIATPVVAWLDDDETADCHWLMEIARAFSERPDAAAVSGTVIPAELETWPQLWFEQYGGHTKGRGFEPAEFRGPRPGGQSALYPLPAFGVGANMAFKTEALRALGGFDTALGAGTPALGGEDTLVFSQLLLAGHLVVFRPSALTRHYHRSDYSSLAKQMVGYGTGLTAYYTSLLRHNWRLIFPLVRLVPIAVQDTFGRSGERLSAVPESFPAELIRLKTRGMLVGPYAYAKGRRRARKAARRRPGDSS